MKAKTAQKIINGVLYISLVIYLIFFYREIDLTLIFHNNQPFFSNTKSFFLPYLQRPGGIAEYLGSYLFQFYENLTHAIVIVLIQLIIFGAFSHILFRKFFSNSFVAIPVAIASIPMIIEYGNYKFLQGFPITFLLAFATALIYQKIKTRKTAGYIFLTFLLILVFFIAGVTGLLLFASITLALELKGKQYTNAIIIIVLSCLLPVLWLLLNPAYSSFQELLPVCFLGGNPFFISRLFNFLPLIIFMLLITGFFFEKHFKTKQFPVWVILINLVVVFPLLNWATYKKSTDPLIKKMITIDRFAYNREWQQLTNTIDEELAKDQFALSMVYRAYYHQGKLLDYLFYYPPIYKENALIIQSPLSSTITIPLSDIYFEMGLLNESRHWANEATTILGWHPRTLKRLAETYIISGEYNTATKYLNILKTSPVNRKWAIEHEEYINCDHCVLENPEYKRLIMSSPATDFFAAIENPYRNLSKLIADGNLSKMAFEYYVAYELLTYNIESLNEVIGKFKIFNYEILPRSVQEAILINNSANRDNKIDILDYQIDQSIGKDFEELSKILFGDYKGNLAQAKPALKNYAKTYWYYYLYSRPMTTKK